MYDITENEYRTLERIEEDMLRKLFKTVKGCSIYQLYLESGHLPTRFYIKRIKLVFYKYILSQKENSLLFTFLMAQKNQPRKGDWYSGVQSIIQEFDLNISEEDIKRTPTNIFKNIAKTSSISAGFKYLKQIQLKGSKGSKIVYDSLTLQDYLNPYSNLTLEDQRYLLSLRCEVNPLRTNFKRNLSMKKVHCVKTCQTELDNEHLVYCSKMNSNPEINFFKLLNGTLPEKLEALQQTKENEKKRNQNIPL